ncbi:Dyp-type peroxidase [Tengunoibacter tsumagoiensis]|uniref:Peroxidase n=1 Tax=Tengunoibacter tsumagoiensis TaxID=2014871 RepID=A0A402AA49_9CHLR|nr:Dyp-type peroxidase [Tengunoibacter tsumagoiensis]GCE16043.1 peroxidase [Tengunoibacter tsumagoiensis]
MNQNQEPRLAVEQIQGNILPGFSKDYAALLFLKIEDVAKCKAWLRKLSPTIATAEEVLTFNRLFKQLRARRGKEASTLKVTWLNVAFSYFALRQLTRGLPSGDLVQQDFQDNSFKKGLAQQASLLNDPVQGVGSPQHWVIGGPDNEADILLIIQGDDQADLQEEVQQLRAEIDAQQPSGVRLLYQESGAALSGALAGHEHFGFQDGISQPGVRGYVSDDPNDLLTPRQNPQDSSQGKPGQQRLWPGAFVFGYPNQARELDREMPGPISQAGPEWATNGSFLVFRRLRQNVGTFHQFLQQESQRLKIAPELLGAKVLGRWTSGAPIVRAPLKDNLQIGEDDCLNNDFTFAVPAPGTASDRPAQAWTGDPTGALCPFFGHIRKAYPREDSTPTGRALASSHSGLEQAFNQQETQTHRLLRRGIAYGPASASTIKAPLVDEVDRGLLFIAYQTSIEEQFEFIMREWINNPDSPVEGSGVDLLLGQVKEGKREVSLPLSGRDETLKAENWITPTGGGYFFAPSIAAIEQYLTK